MKISERAVRVCWLGVCLAASAPAFASNADAIYFGGPIVTVDDKSPSADSPLATVFGIPPDMH